MNPPPRPSPYAWPGMPASFAMPITYELILSVVCAHFKLTHAELSEKNRERKRVRARNITWLLIRRYVTDSNLQEMGRMFRMDHTTVIHGMRSIAQELEENDEVHRLVERLAGRVKQKA